ncbi:hypothetical protein OPT61_g4730 [Boeremia exigua]|uniref:Uncharacterized protein n=1 Tax=Boeremia exigua TaxID=749465 RepID=A0ACC2ICW8_9PLEO|nr:hypothetical protein OPT61_g4730 [Boeremia exigua]
MVDTSNLFKVCSGPFRYPEHNHNSTLIHDGSSGNVPENTQRSIHADDAQLLPTEQTVQHERELVRDHRRRIGLALRSKDRWGVVV